MRVHSYNKHITITGIRISCIQIMDLCLQRTYAYSYIKVPVGTTQVHYTEVPVGTTGLILYYRTYMFIQVSRRSYRAYSYSEIPVRITDQNDTP